MRQLGGGGHRTSRGRSGALGNPHLRELYIGLITLAGVPTVSAPANESGDAGIEWPVTFIIGANKAIVSNNRLFDEGDTVTFVFDAAESSLFLNGELWRSWKLPKPKEPHKPGWADTLFARYRADTLGTQQERVRRAFDSMDKSSLDPTVKPWIGETQVTVRFKGKNEITTLILESLPMEDPSRASEVTVRGLMDAMDRDVPYLEVNDPSRGSTRFGKVAEELLAIFRRAERGIATDEDFAAAHRYYIFEAAEAMQAKAHH